MNYAPLSVDEIKVVFDLENDEAGEVIAQEFLNGTTQLDAVELYRLATYRGVSIEQLIKNIPALIEYRPYLMRI